MKRFLITAFALMGLTICSFAQVKEKEKTKTVTPAQKVVTKKVTTNDAKATAMKPAATTKASMEKPVAAKPAPAKMNTVKTTAAKPATPVKKDGTPDMRYKANKDVAKGKTETADASKNRAANNPTKTKTKTVKKTR